MEKKTAGGKGTSILCVHCGYTARSVYVEYSPGNTGLCICAHCQSLVDEYVENETLIVIIDAILQKPETYRHLFLNCPELCHFNLLNLIWKATLVNLLLDICRRILQGVGNKELIQWDSLTSFISYAGKVASQTTCLNCAFLLVLSLAARLRPMRGSNANSKSTHIVLAVLLSSHFKLVVFAMLVFCPWMNVMIDMLVFSSNIVALKVMLKNTTFHSAVAVMRGAAAKTKMGMLLQNSGLDPFHGGNFYSL